MSYSGSYFSLRRERVYKLGGNFRGVSKAQTLLLIFECVGAGLHFQERSIIDYRCAQAVCYTVDLNAIAKVAGGCCIIILRTFLSIAPFAQTPYMLHKYLVGPLD